MVIDQQWYRLSHVKKRAVKPIKHINSSLNQDEDDTNDQQPKKSFSDAFNELLEDDDEF
jgi:hypothetical protein